MKKLWFVLAAISLIFGCAEDSDKRKIVSNSNEKVEIPNEKQEKEIVYSQLYEKLSEAVETLGYTYDLSSYSENEREVGVIYAELVDFDNDGIEEIYSLMKGRNYPISKYSHRNVDNYVHEIWTGNPNGESAVLSFSGEIDKMECSACDMSASLVEGKDGRTFIKMFSHKTSQGVSVNREWIYAKDSDSTAMDLVVSGYTINNHGVIEYGLNEVTDQAAYETAFAPYVGEERQIIISNSGEKAYGFNYISPATNIGEILSKLAPSVNLVVNNEKLKEEGKKKEILSALAEFSEMKNINHISQEYIQLLVRHVILAESIENETPYGDEMTFDGDTVIAKYREKFGVELELESKNFPQRDLISQSIMTYESGKFYAYPSGFYYDDIDRTYQDVYKVSDDVYYVTFVDNEFRHADYMASTDSMITLKELFADQISNWPDEARQFLKPNIQRYAVVKYIDGAPKVQYMGAQNLSDEQLSSF